jgi:hypothetical protein
MARIRRRLRRMRTLNEQLAPFLLAHDARRNALPLEQRPTPGFPGAVIFHARWLCRWALGGHLLAHPPRNAMILPSGIRPSRCRSPAMILAIQSPVLSACRSMVIWTCIPPAHPCHNRKAPARHHAGVLSFSPPSAPWRPCTTGRRLESGELCHARRNFRPIQPPSRPTSRRGLPMRWLRCSASTTSTPPSSRWAYGATCISRALAAGGCRAGGGVRLQHAVGRRQ